MKKVFAILLVLAIVAGCVFAADSENHSLKVYSTVDEKLPAFQLRFTSSTNSTTKYHFADTNNTELTVGSVSYDSNNKPEAGYVADDSGIDIGVSEAQSVDFYAYVVTNKEGYHAKTKRTFTLVFGGGSFTHVFRNGEGGAATDVLDVDSIAVAAENGSAKGINWSNIDDTTAKTVVVPFNGESVNADEVLLCTATYTWKGEDEIDMGTYFADITLSITSD